MQRAGDNTDMAREVGRRLELFRTRVLKKVTQGALAKSIGTTQTGLSQFESGVRLLSLQVALNLCKHYDLTLDWLYHGDPGGLPVRMNDRLIEIQQ